MDSITKLFVTIILICNCFTAAAMPAGGVPGSNCNGMGELCSDVGSVFPSVVGGTAGGGNNYGCLGSQPGPSWFYLTVSSSGNVDLNLTAPSDIDFILYGPFASLPSAQAGCGMLGSGGAGGAIEDCSFSGTASETPSIVGGIVGEVYVLLVTNYSGTNQNITITNTGGSGAALCCPAPVMTSPTSISICSGSTLNFALTSTIPGATFTWIANTSATVTGESTTIQNGAIINNTLTNLSATNQNVTYTVTPTAAGCTGAPQTVVVTVVKLPTMISANIASICSGTAVNIPLAANPAASTFTWVAADNPNVTGESLILQNTAILNNTLTNPTSNTEIVTYTVTPTSVAGLCVGTPQVVNVTVNPAPTITSPNTATICTGTAVNIPFTADVPSGFSWIGIDNPNVTGESLIAQPTTFLNDLLINTTNVDQIVTYTVTTTATTGGCVGSQIVDVTINPNPTMTSPTATTICSGTAVTLNLTSDIPAAFSWISTANANVTGESIIAQNASTITDVLSNTTLVNQIVNYTVTPSSTVGSCQGLPQNVAVTVFQLLGATAVTNSDCQACNGSISLTSSNGTAPLQFSNDGGVTFQPGNSFGALCGGTTPGSNYSFVIQDAQGCALTVDDDVIDINLPTLNPPVVVNASCNTICDGQITLTGTNLATYQITDVGGIVTTNATGVFNGLCPGTYTILVDNGFGCTVTNVAVITEPTSLQILSLTPDAFVCAGDQIALTATGTGGNGIYTYNWANGPANLGTGASITISPSASMTVCVTMSENCPSPTVQQCMNITVPQPAFPSMSGNIVNGCAPINVTFTNLTTYPNISTTLWEFSDGGSLLLNGNASAVQTFSEGGLYDVTMTVTTDVGCVFDTTYVDYIDAYDYPHALYAYSPNPATIYETEVSFTDFSTPNIVSWLWEFGTNGALGVSTDQNPTVVFPEGQVGTYPILLYVWNATGCKDSIIGEVNVVNDVVLFAPNIFTPDGDSFNEFWRVYINGIDIYDFHLTMFNRWGEIVWESYNPEGAWNGRYGDQEIVKDGVYVWVIEAKDTYNDKKYEFRGHVTVLK